MPVKEAKKANFAEAFKELEDIVQWFEASEVDLEEGLKKFERGLELAKKCRGRLAEVENKVAQIKEKFSDFADGGGDAPDEDEGSDQPRLI